MNSLIVAQLLATQPIEDMDMTNIKDLQKGNSPYSKYNKTPFKYGDEYQDWAEAVAKEGIASERTIAADIKFRERFGVPLYAGPRIEFGE